MTFKDLYEEVAERNHSNFLTGYHHVKRMELALSFLDNVIRNTKDIATVLDAGCGEGLLDELICRHIRSPIEIVGMDVSPLRIKRAKQRVPDASFVVADLYHLPFQRIFNVVIMGEIIEHLHTPKLALENVHGVLKQKGHLILDTPSKSNIVDIFLRLIGHKPTWGLNIDRTHVAFYNEESLKSLLRSSGFEIISIRGISFLRYDLLSLLSFTWNKRKWWLPRLIDTVAERFFKLRNLGAIQVFLSQTKLKRNN